jgi:hypothetical protein
MGLDLLDGKKIDSESHIGEPCIDSMGGVAYDSGVESSQATITRGLVSGNHGELRHLS